MAPSAGAGTKICFMKSAAIALCFALLRKCQQLFKLPSAPGKRILGNNWLSTLCIVKNAWNEYFFIWMNNLHLVLKLGKTCLVLPHVQVYSCECKHLKLLYKEWCYFKISLVQ